MRLIAFKIANEFITKSDPITMVELISGVRTRPEDIARVQSEITEWLRFPIEAHAERLDSLQGFDHTEWRTLSRNKKPVPQNYFWVWQEGNRPFGGIRQWSGSPLIFKGAYRFYTAKHEVFLLLDNSGSWSIPGVEQYLRATMLKGGESNRHWIRQITVI
ncbi:MAG: hypothetical protein HC892_00055 [Saprospiraceae bacterium]|nr:hypothetical protein [Saprospiraceae bacterium]